MSVPRLPPFLAAVMLVASACSPPGLTCGAGTHAEGGACVADPADGGAPDSGSPDAGPPDAGQPPLESEPDCAHALGGAPGPVTNAALSAAHADVRFFGPVTRFAAVDDALAAALEGTTVGPPVLVAYGEALSGVCVLRADARPLSAASVERVGAVAVIHPGTGSVTVPSDATAVAIDLRGLPNAPDLTEALEAATAAALAADLPRAGRTVRALTGLPDESNAMNVYTNTMKPLARPAWPGRAARERPVAVLTGDVMAPACAELAGTLRLAQRAWLFGAPVVASVAESKWRPWGELGLAYRAMNLQGPSGRWPDVIAADDGAGALSSLESRGAPTAVAASATSRPALAAVTPTAAGPGKTLTLGSARAALVVIHGSLRRFFPYFAVVGDRIDERLDETLAAVAAPGALGRKSFFDAVSRLGEAVHDGHNFIYDVSGERSPLGFFPVIIDNVGGEAVVAKSSEPQVQPGDTIVSIEGTPAAQWYQTELTRTAGATDGYRFDLATRKYLDLYGPTQFGVRSLDGGTRTVTVMPASTDDYQLLWQGVRGAERLGAFGAPDIQYVNLDAFGLTAAHPCSEAIAQAQGAAGVVLDMRGYPGEEAFTCLSSFARQRMWSPQFRIPVWTGPDDFSIDDSGQWAIDPAAPSYGGPVVLLVGPITVSAAETLSTLLVDAQRVKKVVGRRSAGTNGNITFLRTPGGLYFSFTGMEVRHLDGGTYHGVGIVPDIDASPTALDFATGRDRAIEAAIAALRAP